MERKRRTINKRGRRAEQKEGARASDEHRRGETEGGLSLSCREKRRERERERANSITEKNC